MQNRPSICSDYVATQFGRSRSIENTMVFERRSRIASVYQVILTPCMAGRLIEVGKNWLLAFCWSMLVLTWRESGSIEEHNGFCPPSQYPLCFTGRRDCITATCKTQWILTLWPESIVFFQWIVNSPSSHIDFGVQANFLFFFANLTFLIFPL